MRIAHTAKQTLSFTNSTTLGGMASARDDCVSNPIVIAVFRARRIVCTARSAASLPYSSFPNNSWHSENSTINGRNPGFLVPRYRGGGRVRADPHRHAAAGVDDDHRLFALVVGGVDPVTARGGSVCGLVAARVRVGRGASGVDEACGTSTSTARSRPKLRSRQAASSAAEQLSDALPHRSGRLRASRSSRAPERERDGRTLAPLSALSADEPRAEPPR